MSIYGSIFKKLLFPLYETKIKGRRTLADLECFEDNLSLPEEALLDIQWQKTLELLIFCEQYVPYYQELFKTVGIFNVKTDIKTMADFERIPVLTKDIIRANKSALIPTNLQRPNLSKSTGGSTGEPLHLELNAESEQARTAVMYRGYGWLGAGVGVKTLFLWGANLSIDNPLKKLKLYLHEKFLHRKTINSFNMTQDNLPTYIEQINRYKPEALVSYTNPLYQLARHINNNAMKVHAPKSIITGAEALEEYQRLEIEKAFRCPVFNTYGCREVMLIGAECFNQNGFHINIDQLIVETLDDKGLPVDEATGNVTLTDLSNYGMPMIRYQNGDLAKLTKSKCCANPLPILKSVEGRKVDVLKSPDGCLIPGLFFPHLLKEYSSVVKYQVHQKASDTIDLKLVVCEPLSPEEKQEISASLAEITTSITLNILEVSDIPLTASGKHRSIISEAA